MPELCLTAAQRRRPFGACGCRRRQTYSGVSPEDRGMLASTRVGARLARSRDRARKAEAARTPGIAECLGWTLG